jgi:D-3-phosphoglycerate dehydrogenase
MAIPSNQATLSDALVSGKLPGAGFDVFAMEPADPANPLSRFDQVAVTPHSADSDLVADIARHALTDMQTILRGTPLPADELVVAPEEIK